MTEKSKLEGKNILIADDEPDVLETLADLLRMCHVTKASSFDEAKKLLESQPFDITILDIMGVNGYQLLDIAKKRNVIPVMLTAHAMSVEDTVKSFRRGAASFLPKDEMHRIVLFLNDILEAEEKSKNLWWRWLQRFETYYGKRFGPDWKNKDKDFWDDFNYPSRWT